MPPTLTLAGSSFGPIDSMEGDFDSSSLTLNYISSAAYNTTLSLCPTASSPGCSSGFTLSQATTSSSYPPTTFPTQTCLDPPELHFQASHLGTTSSNQTLTVTVPLPKSPNLANYQHYTLAIAPESLCWSPSTPPSTPLPSTPSTPTTLPFYTPPQPSDGTTTGNTTVTPEMITVYGMGVYVTDVTR